MSQGATAGAAASPTFPDLRTKRVVVLGGAGGIGSAIVSAFEEQGSRVLSVDAKPGGTSSIVCDVTDEIAVERIAATCGGLDGVDVLINCVGVPGQRRRVVDMDLSDWNDVVRVNLTGVFLASKHFGRRLAAKRGGAIVNIASTAAALPRIEQAHYCASKAGVVHLTRVLALELAHDGVRVNAVCPGATETPFLIAAAENEQKTVADFTRAIVDGDRGTFRAGIPLRRLAQPEDHVAAVLFLASDASRHITGQTVYSDGGEVIL